MTKIQEKLLNMMSWFHEFCVKNEIQYFAVGGTVLGAVRHKGFIPWDDDMDIGLPRSEYDKLMNAVKALPKDCPYRVEFPFENKDYIYPFAKLYDTTTTFIEKTKKPIKRGIYIDLFPLDGVSNSERTAIKRIKSIDKKISFYLLKYAALNKKRGLLKDFLFFLINCIPSFLVSKQSLLKKIEKLCRQYKYEDSVYVGNLVGAWKEKELMKREWFGNPTLTKFETIDIYIPENYDAYLSQLYGDYMKLPPEDRRVSHHNYIYENLNESYLNK